MESGSDHGTADWNVRGCIRRGHDGSKERQEQGDVGRTRWTRARGKEEKERPKEWTNTGGDLNANTKGATRTRRRRQEEAGGQSRRACTRTSKYEGGG